MAKEEAAAMPPHGAARADEARRSAGMGVVVALLVVSVLISYIDRGNLSVAMPLIKVELGLNAAHIGVLLSAFFWTYTIMLFVLCWLVDRIDVSALLALGFLVWSLATAATALVSSFALILLMRLLLGVGESVSFPCYCKILARDLPEQRRGLANGAIIAGMKLGPAVGTLGAGTLMTQFGWRPAFLVIGLASLLWLPAWWRWRPRANAAPEALVVGDASAATKAPPVLDIFQQPAFWATVAGAFCNAYPLYFMVTWLPYYLVQGQHLSMAQMVHTAALYYTVDAGAALASGVLTDRLIRSGAAAGAVRKAIMVVGFGVAALGFMGCAQSGSHDYLAWLIVTGIGLGTGNAGVWTFTQTLAGPRAVGRWSSLQNGFGNLAGVLGPMLTGYLVQWRGTFTAAILVTAGTCLVGALVWGRLIGEFRQVDWAR